MLGWRLDLTIIGAGLLVIVYTVTGGSAAVSLTQKWQMLVIFAGMIAAFFVVLARLPAGLGFGGAAHLAGALGKLEAVDFSFDPSHRYTFWSGLIGGLFLSLSYFGTDQSQVQRYIGGASLREGRLGLMFNAVLKIPMQFCILLLGALVFVFYQFQPAPIFYNRAEWAAPRERAARRRVPRRWKPNTPRSTPRNSKRSPPGRKPAHCTVIAATEQAARTELLAAQKATDDVRAEARLALTAADPRAKTKDSDYVFIGFIVAQLPHGLVGLLVAVMIAAALGSKASELNALGATSTIDLWRHFRPLAGARRGEECPRRQMVHRRLGACFAIGFALFAGFAENLIEAINILGWVFYGVVLGLFLTAFFLKRVGGTAIFWGAVAAQLLVFVLYATLKASPIFGTTLIGCAACMIIRT